MADTALSSKAWIERQNKEREERNKSARQKAEEMSKGTRKNDNLDTRNRVIVEATMKNMELTDEAHRDDEWHERYQRNVDRLAEIAIQEQKADS